MGRKDTYATKVSVKRDSERPWRYVRFTRGKNKPPVKRQPASGVRGGCRLTSVGCGFVFSWRADSTIVAGFPIASFQSHHRWSFSSGTSRTKSRVALASSHCLHDQIARDQRQDANRGMPGWFNDRAAGLKPFTTSSQVNRRRGDTDYQPFCLAFVTNETKPQSIHPSCR